MSSFEPFSLCYRGSQKHKNRPTGEMKGTLCPEWTHDADAQGYKHDPFAHPWKETAAQGLFQESVVSPENQTRRFATAKGVAFEAKPTGDGSWHGYPVPWEAVPADIVQVWIDEQKVTKRQVKLFWRKDRDDIHWPIEADLS